MNQEPTQEDPTRHDLPADYEPCGECGFDHSYEQEEAVKSHAAHEEMMKDYDYEPSTGRWVKIR